MVRDEVRFSNAMEHQRGGSGAHAEVDSFTDKGRRRSAVHVEQNLGKQALGIIFSLCECACSALTCVDSLWCSARAMLVMFHCLSFQCNATHCGSYCVASWYCETRRSVAELPLAVHST